MSEARKKIAGWIVGALLLAGIGITIGVAGWARVQQALGIGPMELPKAEAGDDVFGITADTITVPASASQAMRLQTTPAETQRVGVTLQLTGRTALNMETVAHIRGQFPGRVTNIGPPLGTRVYGPEESKTPTVMCQVESTDLAQAKSDFIKAKVTLEVDQEATKRTQDLVAARVLADKFLLDAQSQEKKDLADYNAAYQKLLVFGLKDIDIANIEKQKGKERMLYEILCPKSGIITEKNVVRGELADPSVNLFTIADLSDLWVYGDVYERDRRRVKEGQNMTIIVASHPDEHFHCKIESVSPVLDANTRSIRIRGELKNPDGRLLADMYCTIILEVEPPTDSIILPSDAIIWREKSAYAFVQVGAKEGSITYQKRLVKVEPLASGIGFEAVPQAGASPASSSDSVQPETGRPVDGRRPRADVRVIEGVKAGEQVVTRNALGLFQEMDDHDADKMAPATNPSATGAHGKAE